MEVYDKAKHHFLGDFPTELPMEQAYVHIGMFLGWMIEKELYSEEFEDEAALQIHRFGKREISCIILSELWDGHLSEEQLNDEGNQFTKNYYPKNYLKDYEETLGKGKNSIYHVEDNWDNFKKLSGTLTKRFDEWRAKG